MQCHRKDSTSNLCKDVPCANGHPGVGLSTHEGLASRPGESFLYTCRSFIISLHHLRSIMISCMLGAGVILVPSRVSTLQIKDNVSIAITTSISFAFANIKIMLTRHCCSRSIVRAKSGQCAEDLSSSTSPHSTIVMIIMMVMNRMMMMAMIIIMMAMNRMMMVVKQATWNPGETDVFIIQSKPFGQGSLHSFLWSLGV